MAKRKFRGNFIYKIRLKAGNSIEGFTIITIISNDVIASGVARKRKCFEIIIRIKNLVCFLSEMLASINI